MQIEILSPNKILYKGESEQITLPGKKGQFQILKNHAPIFALLTEGEIIIEKKRRFSISSGIVKGLNNEIIILIKE